MLDHDKCTFVLLVSLSLLLAIGCGQDAETEDAAVQDAGSDARDAAVTSTDDDDVDAGSDAVEDTGPDVDPTSPDVEPSLEGQCDEDQLELRKVHYNEEMTFDIDTVEAAIPYNYGVRGDPDIGHYWYLSMVGVSIESELDLYEVVFEFDPSVPMSFKGGGGWDSPIVLGNHDHPDRDSRLENGNVMEFNFGNSYQDFPAEPLNVTVVKEENGRPGLLGIWAIYRCWSNG